MAALSDKEKYALVARASCLERRIKKLYLEVMSGNGVKLIEIRMASAEKLPLKGDVLWEIAVMRYLAEEVVRYEPDEIGFSIEMNIKGIAVLTVDYVGNYLINGMPRPFKALYTSYDPIPF